MRDYQTAPRLAEPPMGYALPLPTWPSPLTSSPSRRTARKEKERLYKQITRRVQR